MCYDKPPKWVKSGVPVNSDLSNTREGESQAIYSVKQTLFYPQIFL